MKTKKIIKRLLLAHGYFQLLDKNSRDIEFNCSDEET